MSNLHPAQVLFVVVMAAVLLRWNLWRAVAFVSPASVLLDVDTPAEHAQVPGALEPAHATLTGLGFTFLGTHLEHPRFGKRLVTWDYVHPTEQVFASLTLGLGGQPRLYFFTPTAGGGFVLTADHRRPAREVKGHYLSGSVEGAAPDRLLKVHLRRVPEVGAPQGPWTLDGRVVAARNWYLGAGKTEVRQQNAVGLLWSLGAIGMVGAAFLGRSS